MKHITDIIIPIIIKVMLERTITLIIKGNTKRTIQIVDILLVVVEKNAGVVEVLIITCIIVMLIQIEDIVEDVIGITTMKDFVKVFLNQ